MEILNLNTIKQKQSSIVINRKYYEDNEPIIVNTKYYIKTMKQFQYLYNLFNLNNTSSTNYLIKLKEPKKYSGYKIELNIQKSNYIPVTSCDASEKKLTRSYFTSSPSVFLNQISYILTPMGHDLYYMHLANYISLIANIDPKIGIVITGYNYKKKIATVFEISKTFCSYTTYKTSIYREIFDLKKYAWDGNNIVMPLKSFALYPFNLFPEMNYNWKVNSNWSSYKFEQRKLHK